MSTPPDSQTDSQASAPTYDNMRGCLTLTFLAILAVIGTLIAVLVFNDFGK